MLYGFLLHCMVLQARVCLTSAALSVQVPFNTDINSKEGTAPRSARTGFLPTPRVMELDTWRTTVD